MSPHFHPLSNWILFFLLLIATAILAIMMIVAVVKHWDVLTEIVMMYALILLVFFTIIVGMTVFMRRRFKLEGMKTTDKSLEISAFEGLGSNPFA